MTKARPLISDIQTTRMKFNPGDRILIRTSVNLSQAQQDQLKKSITKFAGEDVRILIMNCLTSRLVVKRENGSIERLADESYGQFQPENKGIANISCSVINFDSKDQIIYMCREVTECKHPNNSLLIVKHLRSWLKQWVGNDVEIIIAKEGFV